MLLQFDWVCHPEATALIESLLVKNSYIENLERELFLKTSTRFFDWIDHIVVNFSIPLEKDLEKNGFIQERTMPSYTVFFHPGAQLPKILLRNENCFFPVGVALKVEKIADFLMVHKISKVISGEPWSPFRQAFIHEEKGITLSVVERNGSQTMEYNSHDGDLKTILEFIERWQTRNRTGFEDAFSLLEEYVPLLGTGVAAHCVLTVERAFWQAKNQAAQHQKNRQDALGLGWANHDHHTFRSSRPHFIKLVRLFETLGFTCRERYYAGEKAGWGAQVMENREAGLVLFLDVDLSPDEVALDFSHNPLSEKESLGTVGLWCALHGDSILEAGMHHLEAQFSFHKLREDLTEVGIDVMPPFSDFSYLRQAFTKGEMWKVAPERIEKLLNKKQITKEQADKFLQEGAIGSHLENLERHEGYKGFNKEGVDLILKKTDPRTVQF